jgi:RimJ/RimL family protein N-acetyltransferase
VEDGACWCAVASDGAVAARSSSATPVAISFGWTEFAALGAAIDALPSVAAVNGPEDAVVRLQAALGRLPRGVTRERLFRCDRLLAPTPVAGCSRLATARDEALLRLWFAEFEEEALGRPRGPAEVEAAVRQSLEGHRCWLWLDGSGQPVSFAREQAGRCGVARIGPVYTPPSFRGRGYGAAVTAIATRAVLDAGNVPVLFTDLANPTSNAVYRRLGYRAVEDFRLVRFGD